MIKGFRFTNQLSNAEVDARIHQEIFNKNDGIFYGMELSHTKDSITISEGLCEIAGRPVGVVGSEAISVSSENLYCLLVLEIDLSKESSVDTFNQASFKILTSSISYPTLTQQDINRIDGTNNLYQMEFARFLTDSNGIDDMNFSDTRKHLSFDNIYEEIRKHIQDIDDGSLYFEKSNIYSCAYEVEYTNDVSDNIAQYYIDYPEGFNYYNCIILSLAGGVSKDGKVIWVQTSNTDICNPYVVNADNLNAILDVDRIVVYLRTIANVPIVQRFQIVLLKIS